MAEEIEEQATTTETETDWQAKYEEMRGHMREWEKKAKANQSAADELEKLRASQMTEHEKANARAEAAEAELNTLKAEQARNKAAQEIAADTGVPMELLLYCADADAMADFAKEYAGKQPVVHSAPSAAVSRIVRGGGEKSKGEIFADAMGEFFK